MPLPICFAVSPAFTLSPHWIERETSACDSPSRSYHTLPIISSTHLILFWMKSTNHYNHFNTCQQVAPHLTCQAFISTSGNGWREKPTKHKLMTSRFYSFTGLFLIFFSPQLALRDILETKYQDLRVSESPWVIAGLRFHIYQTHPRLFLPFLSLWKQPSNVVSLYISQGSVHFWKLGCSVCTTLDFTS